MARIRTFRLVVGWVLLSPAVSLQASEPAAASIKDILSHEIIGTRQSLADTVDFADSIIPRMPR